MDITNVVRYILQEHASICHTRRYTGEKYQIHLAEVAAMAALVHHDYANEVPFHVFVATAWAHDLLEDTKGTADGLFDHTADWYLDDRINLIKGVGFLTDIADPAMSREVRLVVNANRLSSAPRWVQGIKLCDGYSNIPSIAHHDPSFAMVYLKEKTKSIDGFTHEHKVIRSFLDPVIAEAEHLLSKQKSCPGCNVGKMVLRNKDLYYMTASGTIENVQDILGYHCTRCAYTELSSEQVTKRIRKLSKIPNSNIKINYD